MLKKNKFLLLFLLAIVLLLPACGRREKAEPIMDLPAEDGRYHYRNDDLGFRLALPAEFIYYQTQRRAGDGYADIEFFVPTNDADYAVSVPGYAMPVVVRVEEGAADGESDGPPRQRMGEKGGKSYSILFWENAPRDWREKWTEEMRQEIMDGFQLYNANAAN